MLTGSLSKLADLIAEDSVPAWIRKQLECKRGDIIAAFDAGQPYELHGPSGEVITISAYYKVEAK
jgi:hypothetical protein